MSGSLEGGLFTRARRSQSLSTELAGLGARDRLLCDCFWTDRARLLDAANHQAIQIYGYHRGSPEHHSLHHWRRHHVLVGSPVGRSQGTVLALHHSIADLLRRIYRDRPFHIAMDLSFRDGHQHLSISLGGSSLLHFTSLFSRRGRLGWRYGHLQRGGQYWRLFRTLDSWLRETKVRGLRCLVFVRSGGADLSGSRRLLAVHQ
ncbi:MAG: hypothetical protein QOH78_2097 [Verrucomicrobiota bacterium]